jgi:hypothetical protein
MRGYLIVIAVFILSSCKPDSSPAGQQDNADALFVRLDPASSGIDFVNEVSNNPDFNIFRYRNFYNGGGVAIGDINNDGLSDVFLTKNQGKNKLYLNRGNMQFEDITESAGVGGSKAWSTGVVMVDINQDGFLDIYVCNAGYVEGDDQENELFINNGGKGISFTEQAAAYNLNESGYTTHTAFFDYDMDGDLDAYILNNSFIPVNTLNYSNKRELDAEDWPVADFLKGGGDRLMRNDGNTFTEVTDEAGIYSSLIGYGLGVAVGDVNGDLWPDLYISNDFFERDYLYLNQQDGTFKEDITGWMEHISLFSMGADLADINNDGYPEIFATDMLPDNDYRLKSTTVFDSYNLYLMKLQRGFYHQYMQNTLQLNNKNGSFSEIGHYSGVAASDWSWGALLFDADNDSYRDIFVCNGIYNDLTNQDFISFFANDVIQKMALTGEKKDLQEIIDKMPSTPVPNRMFHNQQDLTFKEVSSNWGLDEPSFSNGAAYGDLDNDGDLDLVINNLNQQAMVYKNRLNEKANQHYLQVLLKGKEKNINAIGAQVYVHHSNGTLHAEMMPTRGFQSSVDYKLHFGLGSLTAVDSLVVVWPDQQSTSIPTPSIDTLHSIRYEEVVKTPWQPRRTVAATAGQSQPFREMEHNFPAHQEDRFIDFFQEGLAIKMVSREGPVAITEDIDGDGREDVILGGASGFPLKMMIQKERGFVESNTKTFERDSYHEDTALALFDADGDGDLDLFAGSGGNLPAPNTRYLQDRIYLNNGNGVFELARNALPRFLNNTSAVVPIDFDEDGDMDIFVASRSVPNIYGLSPENALWENNGSGQFRNVIATKAPALAEVGMITDVRQVDLLGDAQSELVLTGEWMSPVVYTIQNGKIEKVATSLEAYKGWWSSLSSADVDGDGDQDLILGNRGENFAFTGSTEAPARLWVSDFDNNGTIEKIVTQNLDGRDMPLPMKSELTGQIVSLKKQNLKHEDYARKSIQELFGQEKINQAIVKEANYFKSAIAINQGDGQFDVQALPAEVQLSCICAIYCEDLNGDDQPDLVLGGNDSGFLPQFAKLDASFGHVLINNGNGNFEPVTSTHSGFFVKGDMKQIQPIKIDGKPHLLVLLNSQQPKLYRIDTQEWMN